MTTSVGDGQWATDARRKHNERDSPVRVLNHWLSIGSHRPSPGAASASPTMRDRSFAVCYRPVTSHFSQAVSVPGPSACRLECACVRAFVRACVRTCMASIVSYGSIEQPEVRVLLTWSPAASPVASASPDNESSPRLVLARRGHGNRGAEQKERNPPAIAPPLFTSRPVSTKSSEAGQRTGELRLQGAVSPRQTPIG